MSSEAVKALNDMALGTTGFGRRGPTEPGVEAHVTSQDQSIEMEMTDASQSPSWSSEYTSNSNLSHHELGAISRLDRVELVRIATNISRRKSSVAGLPPIDASTSTYLDEYSTSLDPNHPDFDVEKWARAFVKQMQDSGSTGKTTSLTFQDLDISGHGSSIQVQNTVGSVLSTPLRLGRRIGFGGRTSPKQILHGFNGHVKQGELLIVLGRPGSGCSTLLKSFCGELSGLELGKTSRIHFDGIPLSQMQKEFKGEAIYNQEVDKHLPHLTVGQTLEFAAAVRTPAHRIQGISRKQYAKYIAKVLMAVFSLSHTQNTLVGSEFVRGVSGGERKRVSIAEMVMSSAPFCAWDNSTRGLDSATALKFIQSLRIAADVGRATQAVAIYQPSQAIYDLFDKATVLYEGRQIYFGPANQAKLYFEEMGWQCPARQTTGDFLTSITNPEERRAIPGKESMVPRSPGEFEQVWKNSPAYRQLKEDMILQEQSRIQKDTRENAAGELREQKVYRQAKHVRPNSPFTVSWPMQIRYCTKRAYQQRWNARAATIAQVSVQITLSLIVGSIFYGTPDATAGFFSKGSVLFIAILMNALQAISEIPGLYEQRPIVEKHASYAFYHPAAEAAAGLVADLPIKFMSSTIFNVILYFLSGLRRQPAQFFLYFLISFLSTFVMIAIFRTMAAITKTVAQAMTLSGILVLALVIYTGFTIPVPLMKPWFSWIRWINPVFYAFEILVANEFHGRDFPCSSIVPPYSPPVGDAWICAVKGAVPGQYTVSGDAFIQANYSYSYSHVWRNFGILLAFFIFFMLLYLVAIEINSEGTGTAESLVFKRGHIPASMKATRSPTDEESKGSDRLVTARGDERFEAEEVLSPQQDIFTWRHINYGIHIKGQERKLLNDVSGWVKPGTLTALMGVSGAGKTTLLDALAQRTTKGVVTGDMLVNGKPLEASFQRNTGYCQQQDLHLETSTVREALLFSAMLRQPKSVPASEKVAFVEDIISMLDMNEFSNAIVGIPGEGLNVLQRKLLTIGVELAARPKLLLFLDEPTSGLDSQSSWAICSLMRKLASSGQSILCTIHQPSALLFQSFDRLLFLAKGGKTVYFGDIGENSRTLLDYFERNGGPKCHDAENPAEYMLRVVNEGTATGGQDWHDIWTASAEALSVQQELNRIHTEKKNVPVARGSQSKAEARSEFAMPLTSQLQVVTKRQFQYYWRMPSYIFAKFILGIAAGLFNGFTFYQAGHSQAGLQLIIFSVFLLTTIFTTLVQQIQPHFVTQRSLYEVRERPSKAYSWKAFIIASVAVEMPFQILTGILIFACFYYPVIGIQASLRQGLVLLYVIQLFIYAAAFAQMTIVAFPNAETAGSIVTLLTLMSTIFNGVLQPPNALPGFWIFMYRVSPFTYWVSGIVATETHGRQVTCADDEFLRFGPPSGQTCYEYLAPFLVRSPGYLRDPNSTKTCEFCTYSTADQYLAGSRIYWSDKWRNYGIFWGYILFNITMAVVLYYVFRVNKWRKS